MGGGGFPSSITLCAELQAGPLLSPHAQRVLSAECGRRDMWHVPYAPLPHVTAVLGGSALGSRAPLYLVVIHDGVEGLDPHGVYVPVQDDPLGAVVRDVGQVPHDGGEEACGRRWLCQIQLWAALPEATGAETKLAPSCPLWANTGLSLRGGQCPTSEGQQRPSDRRGPGSFPALLLTPRTHLYDSTPDPAPQHPPQVWSSSQIQQPYAEGHCPALHPFTHPFPLSFIHSIEVC